jgi:hypothetical protein
MLKTLKLNTTVQKNKEIHLWIKLSLGYFLLVGLLGAWLRGWYTLPDLGLIYKNFLHTHSHIAMLGWVFNLLLIGIIRSYFSENIKDFRLCFWLIQISVLGMLVSFPIQGYGLYSIIFSTAHIFFSWWFAFKTWKRLNLIPVRNTSMLFIKAGLIFMVLSCAGPFGLGIIMAKGLSESPLYQLAIYFYLHFQYDGWFTFTILGLFLRLLEIKHIPYPVKTVQKGFFLLFISCIPVYALSTLWTHPPLWVYIAGGLGAMTQIIALTAIVPVLFKRNNLEYSSSIKWLLSTAWICLCAKIVLQLVSVHPVLADLAFYVRNFTIGYLHLVFLGFVTPFLVSWLSLLGYIPQKGKKIKIAITLLITGFVLTETLIFGQPMSISIFSQGLPGYEMALFLTSWLLPASSLLIFIAQKNEKEKPIPFPNKTIQTDVVAYQK